jgi:hypothetical protein
MALYSIRHAVGIAIATALNADTDLVALFAPGGSQDPKFKYRKHPLGRERPWLTGAFVCPKAIQVPYHENAVHEHLYRYRVSLCFPCDQDNVQEQSLREAAIERIEDIFRYKGNRLMPATIKALNTAFATNANGATVQSTNVEPSDPYNEAAFKDGYDVLSCLVLVSILQRPFNSESL